MSSVRIIPKNRYRRSTWKNGLGHTDEIEIYPATADLKRGDFLWRLSSARIGQASPFSPFPDHDRILVVLQGAGLRMSHSFVEGEEEETVEVPPLSAYEFPGDVASRCELVEGPITDFSVFLRKGEIEGVAETAELAAGDVFEWQPQGRWNFAFAVRGSFGVELEALLPGRAPLELPEGDCCRVELDRPLGEEQRLVFRAGDAGGALVFVSLQGSG